MNCIFCKIINGEIPSKKLYEDENLIVIMDANPCVDGHTLIIPKKHYTDYQELDDNITKHIFDTAKKIGPEIMQKLSASSLTLLINYGDDQKVKHFHLHLLPNFSEKKANTTKSSDEIYNILKN